MDALHGCHTFIFDSGQTCYHLLLPYRVYNLTAYLSVLISRNEYYYYLGYNLEKLSQICFRLNQP